MRRGALQFIGAALVISAAVAIVTWPLPLHLSDRLNGNMDAFFSTWRLAWIADAVRTPGLSLFEAPIFYPEPRTFAYSDAILLPGLAAAPLRYAGAAPVLTYNLTLLAAFISGGLAVVLLVRQLTGRLDAAVLAGVIFAVSPHRLEHLAHLEMQAAMWMPIALWLWHRGIETRSTRATALAVLCVAAQWLSCIYYGLLFVPVIAAVVATEWWFVEPSARWRILRAAAASGLVAAVIIGVYSLPYLANRSGTGDRSDDEVATYSATLRDYLHAHPQNRSYGPLLSAGGRPERFLFPGVIAVMLAATGGLTAGMGHKRWVYLAAGLVAVDLSLGVNGVLFPLLREWVLPYRGLRAPARAATLVMLVLSVFAGWGAAALLTRLRRPAARAAVFLLLTAGLVIEYRAPGELWTAPVPQPIGQFGITRGSVLLELPLPALDRIDLSVDAVYMMRRIGTWPRMLNGFSGYYPDSYGQLVERLGGFPDDRAMAEIRRLGVTTLTLHQQWLPAAQFDAWTTALAVRPGVRRLGFEEEDGRRVAVYELATDSPAGATASPAPR